MLMNRKVFYDTVRNAPFGGVLTQRNIDGTEPLLDYWEKSHRHDPIEFLAYILAGVFHETGGTMVPVRETFATSDSQARGRLEAAWKAGKLRHVKTPYWRDNWFGRGRIQNTHRTNYEKIARRFNRPGLLDDPNLLLQDLNFDAKVTIEGHFMGLWTGKKLSDFMRSGAFDAKSARQIVNGMDCASQIALHYRAFLTGLKAALRASPIPSPTPSPTPTPIPLPDAVVNVPPPPPTPPVITDVIPPTGDGTSPAMSKINWTAFIAAISGILGTIGTFLKQIDSWPGVVGVCAIILVCFVLIVVFRKQIAYQFGA